MRWVFIPRPAAPSVRRYDVNYIFLRTVVALWLGLGALLPVSPLGSVGASPWLSQPIGCETTVGGAIASASSVQEWTFFGAGGQQVAVAVGTPVLGALAAQLIQGTSATRMQRELGQSRAEVVLIATLPQDDQYTVAVYASAPAASASPIDYRLTLY